MFKFNEDKNLIGRIAALLVLAAAAFWLFKFLCFNCLASAP